MSQRSSTERDIRSKSVHRDVNDDDDVTLITRQKSAAAVLMSLKEYESLMETAHLLRHPKNAMRLMKAIDDIENRRHITRHELIDE